MHKIHPIGNCGGRLKHAKETEDAKYFQINISRLPSLSRLPQAPRNYLGIFSPRLTTVFNTPFSSLK